MTSVVLFGLYIDFSVTAYSVFLSLYKNWSNYFTAQMHYSNTDIYVQNLVDIWLQQNRTNNAHEF